MAKSERSSDMQGYAVRLSAFVSNICIAILIAWSKEDVVKDSVNLMLQNYVILLSSALSIARKDLTVADAHFTLTLTISPLSLYFIYSTYRFIRRRPNHLYDCLGSAKVVTVTMSAILLTCWLVFDLLIYFSGAFEGDGCKATLIGWIEYKIFSVLIKLILPAVLICLFPLFWIIYFIRHFKDIQEEYQRHMKKTVEPWKRFHLVQSLGRSIKSFIIAQWDVITCSHKWLFFLTIFAFYASWASSLLIWVIDINRNFHAAATVIETDLKPYTPEDFDPLSYGQLLAAAVVIEPIWGVFKLSFFKKHKILSWLKQWPQSVWNGIVFIFTGDRNPWKKILEGQRMHEPEGPDHKHLLNPHVLELNELPISTKGSVYEGLSLEQAPGAKAEVIFPRSGSPQLVTAYSSLYPEVPDHGPGLSRHCTV